MNLWRAFILAPFFFFGFDLSAQEAQGPALDSVFPDFDYVSIGGDSIRSADLKDKVVVINIWFVGCTGCKQEEPYLRKITEYYQHDEEIVFVGFCMSKPDRIVKYLERNGDIGYTNISLSRAEVEEKFGVVMSPTHFVVKDGLLKAKYTGPIVPQLKSVDWMKEEIEKSKRGDWIEKFDSASGK